MEKIETIATIEEQGTRLDVFVSDTCNFSRAGAQKLIANGHVWVNSQNQNKSYKLLPNDMVTVEILPPKDLQITAQDIPLDIVYEDEHLLVVNKAKGMVVHPAAGNYDGTLVNALMFHCKDRLSGIGGEIRPGIVHRIDKDTSGLIVVAKNDATHQGLAIQFAAHSITREYQAIVYGRIKQFTGTIDAQIGRSHNDRKKMAVRQNNAKHAVTHYKVINNYEKFSHVKLWLETGRTHQIRVHLSEIGHPLAGDSVYGPKKVIKKLNGQCLHAGKLGFIHPITKQYCEYFAELPQYFMRFMQELGEAIE